MGLYVRIVYAPGLPIWRPAAGHEIELIILNGRPCLRVSQWIAGRRYLIAYAWNVRQVAQHVDLADLVEVVDLTEAKKRRDRQRADAPRRPDLVVGERVARKIR
ncbi:hypothetical protein AB0B45_15330 [Nonomuraea sp. NPDC049152]|uniref:hypothetical protein n=1 Tax=Nonomuraea sp. NPDC049152 TaxID=3154350 RepID=UPI0033C8C18D